MKTQQSVLDEYVSCYRGYRGRESIAIVSILDWLTTDHYKEEILAIRKEGSKEKRSAMKAQLLAVTISGVFEPTREESNLKLHSGLLSIDIDQQENPCLNNIKRVKAAIASVPEIAYCGLSAGGKGLFCIVRIEKPEKHKLYFDALEKFFRSEFGINIDTAPKNVCALRGISYDPDAYFNHNAAIFKNLPASENKRSYRPANTRTDNTIVNKILMAVLSTKTDLTAARSDWFQICCALANEFGEEGRNLFHAFSQFHQKYSREECDTLYDDVLSREPYNYSIGTLWHIAQEHGIV